MKTKPIFLFVLMFIFCCTATSYAANISIQVDGYYGGTSTITGNYTITSQNAADLDPDMDVTLTYQYNNFSVIQSVSMQGTITVTSSDQTDTHTGTGNVIVTIGGTPYNVECNFQSNDDTNTFTPSSYIKINGVSYPVTSDLLKIFENIGMMIN